MKATRTLALEALKTYRAAAAGSDFDAESKTFFDLARKAIAALESEEDEEDEPVAWAMDRPDGLILDVICPEEHARHAGGYTIPLYAAPLPAVPKGWQLVTICMLKQVTEALAARLGTNADEWPLVMSARSIIEDLE